MKAGFVPAFFYGRAKKEAGSDCSDRLRMLKPDELSSADGAGRAGVDTGTTVDAGVTVNFVLVGSGLLEVFLFRKRITGISF